MNNNLKKFVLISVVASGMLAFISAPAAKDEKKFPEINFDFNKALEKLFKDHREYVKKAMKNAGVDGADSDDPVQNAINNCVTGLKNVGYQLSSMLVTPTGPGGAGAEARSLTPEEIESEICDEVGIDGGDTVIVCIRTKKATADN